MKRFLAMLITVILLIGITMMPLKGSLSASEFRFHPEPQDIEIKVQNARSMNNTGAEIMRLAFEKGYGEISGKIINIKPAGYFNVWEGIVSRYQWFMDLDGDNYADIQGYTAYSVPVNQNTLFVIDMSRRDGSVGSFWYRPYQLLEDCVYSAQNNYGDLINIISLPVSVKILNVVKIGDSGHEKCSCLGREFEKFWISLKISVDVNGDTQADLEICGEILWDELSSLPKVGDRAIIKNSFLHPNQLILPQ